MTEQAPRTLSQKILEAKAGKTIEPGESVDVTPDVVLSTGDTADICRKLASLGIDNVYDPDLHVVVVDRCASAAFAIDTADHQRISSFVEDQGIEHFFDLYEGFCHQVLVEQGFVTPGRLIVGSDPRIVACGALGTLAVGIDHEAMATVMATGKIGLRAPETCRIEVVGRLPHHVTPMDLILKIIGDLGAEGVLHHAVEFGGPTLRHMTLSGRMTMCHMAAMMGTNNSYVVPDQNTLAYLNGRARGNFSLIYSDPEAEYSEVRTYDVSELEPYISQSERVDSAVLVSEVDGTKVRQIILGGCTNGQLADLQAAASVLENRKVASSTHLLVVPASHEVLRDAVSDGTLSILLDAGAFLLNPHCGLCLNQQVSALPPGEVVLSTAHSGPSGQGSCPQAGVYLGSTLTCAAAAVAGEICDVRTVVAVADPISTEAGWSTVGRRVRKHS